MISDLDQEYLSSDLDTSHISIFKNKSNLKNKLYPILDFNDETLPQNNQIIKNEKKINIKNDINDLENKFNEININDDDDNDNIEVKENKLDPLEIELRKKLSVLEIDSLKKELKEKKCSIGPINDYNKKLYVNKLAKLKMTKMNFS